MPEAVFTISADIEPRLDQRALENQAQLLARQMNQILGKNVDKVGVRGDTRSFNQVKNQLQDTSRASQLLQRSMGSLRNTIQSVPARAREGFLKLTDAMTVTRRNVVGFGGSIRDIIRDTTKFEQALENIHVSGGIFRDLDSSFGSTIAQVRSGTSLIDQFAARGDHLAQMFLPMTKTSAAAQLNLEGLQQTLEGVARSFRAGFNASGAKALDASSVSTGSLNAELNHLQRTFLNLGKVLPKGTAQQKAFFDTFEEAKSKGGVDDFVKGLVQQRDAANQIAGPIGRVKVALGLVTKEGHDAAKVLRNETNQALVQLEAQFPGTVQGFDRLAARVRNAKDSFLAAGDTFRKVLDGVAAAIPGENLGVILSRTFDTTDALGGASNFFDGMTNRFIALRATGKSVPEAIGKAFKKTFSELDFVGKFVAKMDEVRETLGRVAVQTVFAAQFLKDDLTKGFIKVREAYQKVAAIPFGDLIGDTVNNISDRFIAARVAVNRFGQNAITVVRGLSGRLADFVNKDVGDRIGNTVNLISDRINALRKVSFGDLIGNSVNKISDAFIAARAAVNNFNHNAIPATRAFFKNLKKEGDGAEGPLKKLSSLFDHSLSFFERQSPKRRGPILHGATPGDKPPTEPVAETGFLAAIRKRNQVRAEKLAKEAQRKATPGAGTIDDGAVGTLPLAKFGDALKAQIDGLPAKLAPSLAATGRRIGESLMNGVLTGVTAGIKSVEAAIAKVGASAKAAGGGPKAPAVQVADQTPAPKTIQLTKVTDAKAKFEETGRANGAALAQGTLDGANFETKVGGALQNQINGITGKLAGPVDAAGRTIGGGLAGGILAGVGANAKNIEAAIGKTASDTGTSAGRRLGNAVLSGVKAPFKIVKDVVGTTFRAFLGKAPAEGIGRIGKAASMALAPIRLLSHGIGKTLGQGLQLATSAFKVAGTALAGFVGVAIATGAQFNSLQAVIRSTLPVILGSAAASEKLLAEINTLNDTSPFARSAFLELTRVLAGFGVQAEKIAPLIDSIQQAVAATGGGESDLLELGQAFARLQSQGRLSLDIIQSFSSRGIDVIAILGGEFKKTQGEIREMISGGLIPADKAIDALTKGLKNKFDGATDAVSKNLPGALDRVKAKTRDFGAELTRAFVSPTGGGAVVDLLNSFATVVSTITKVFLPLLRPALESVAGAITNISGKAAAFAKTLGSFEARGLKEFAGGLDGLLGPIVALVAFLPGLVSTIPVIGPMFASLVSGPATATIAITAFLLTLQPVREGLAEFAKSLAPLGAGLLPKMAAAFKALGNAVGPIVGVIFKALGPIVLAAGNALGELFDQLPPIFNAFKRLFAAIEPFIQIMKNGFIIMFKQVQVAFKLLGPAITFVINLIAAIAEKVKPLVQDFADFTEKIQESMIVQEVFEAIAGAVTWVIDKLKGFLDVFNNILRFLHIPEISIDLDISGTDAAENAAVSIKNLTDDETKALKEQNKAADKAADALSDGYKKAAKDAETAGAKVSGLTDQIKQQMGAYQQSIEPLIAAGQAVKAAHAAQADAAQGVRDASANVSQILAEQARALRDVIKPTDELAVAQRNLVRLQNSIRDSFRQEIELQEKLKDLRGEDATDERAALDRGLERAKIALNKAQKDQNDLLNEANKAQKTSVSLAGLSLDQIKSRLSSVRLSLKSQKTAPKTEKTAQEIADEQKTAALDVEDAKQGVKDATNAKVQFELDTAIQIRDTEEQLLAIAADRADQRLEEQNQLNHIIDLRKGETAEQAVIKDFEDKIKGARDASEKAARAVTEAIKSSTLAELELKAKSAEVRGDYEAQWGFQQSINNLKRDGLVFDAATEESLSKQSASIIQIIKDYRTAQADLDRMTLDAQRAAVADLGGRSSQRDLLDRQVRSGVFDEKTLVGIKDVADQFKEALANASTSGAIVNRAGETIVLDTTPGGQLDNILMNLVEEKVMSPDSTYRQILKKILAELGLTISGFATGYAPGQIHRGMNDGRGLVRMFEYGKEAVLPLTRKYDLSRVVNNPSVLPKILDALPKISLEDTSKAPGLLTSLQRFSQPTSTEASGLSAIKRSNGRADRGGSSDAMHRKEQREFVGSVGDAVKNAVKEALSESNGSLGSDIDINVQPSSNNEVLIAREVRRQLEKALGRL